MATKTKATKTKKTTTAKRKLAAEIARRTKLFKAASPAQKRVLIAKDVIAQIKANRYAAKTGTWVALYNKNAKKIDFGPYSAASRKNAQVQSLFLSGDVAKCECCALGGVMMSCTLYNNNQTLADFYEYDCDVGAVVGYGDKFSNGLHRVFSRQQLALIECAFEGGRGGFFVSLNPTSTCTPVVDPLLQNVPRDTLARAIDYAKKYATPEKRMIAIMQNIIKNDGTFKP